MICHCQCSNIQIRISKPEFPCFFLWLTPSIFSVICNEFVFILCILVRWIDIQLPPFDTQFHDTFLGAYACSGGGRIQGSKKYFYLFSGNLPFFLKLIDHHLCASYYRGFSGMDFKLRSSLIDTGSFEDRSPQQFLGMLFSGFLTKYWCNLLMKICTKSNLTNTCIFVLVP